MNEHSANHLTVQYRATAAYQAQMAQEKRERLAEAQRQRTSIITWMVETLREQLQVLVAPAGVVINYIPNRNLKRASVSIDGLTFFAEGFASEAWGRGAYEHNPRLHAIVPCPRCGQDVSGYAGTLENLGELLAVGTVHYLDGGRLCEASTDAERDAEAWEDVYGGLEHAEVAL